MKANKKIYFASDFHLGIPDYESSLKRERLIVRWLDEIKLDASHLFLMGDLFDFWFEYKTVVPKGFVRLLGKLAELSDAGILIHVFTGNHDMWLFDYLPKELGITLHRHPIVKSFYGKKFYLGHGDGLGPGDYGYKLIKKVFANPFCQWLFARFHPNFGMSLANYWSKKSRIANGVKDELMKAPEQEWLFVYSKELLRKEQYDFFIFGHRHLPLDLKINEKSRYINTGEWVNYRSYAVFDGETLELKYYPEK